jgi:hypothetical protein
MANACGVDQLDGDSLDCYFLCNEIAGGAWDCGNDGPLTLDQPVEEARLANVRPADDREREAVVNKFSVGKRLGEFLQWSADRRYELKNLIGRQDRNIILGEIDAGFKKSDQFNQFLLHGLQAARDRAVQLLGGDFGLIERLRIDQIANRFSLGEIDAAVQKGAHGELSRLGETRASSDRQFNHTAENDRRSMRGNFHDVVGGVGMRLGKIRDHDFVDSLRGNSNVSPCLRFNQFSELSVAGNELMLKSQHGGSDRLRLWARHADDSNPAPTRRRGDGDDRIVEIHAMILMV